MGDENKNTLDKEAIRSMVGDAVKDAISKVVPDIVKQTKASIVEDSQPKLRVTPEQFRDLTNRASAISPEAMNQVTNFCLEGKTEPEVLRYLTDELTKGSDGDKAGSFDKDGDGTKRGQDKANNKENVRSFKDITDDQFFNTLKRPSSVIIN